MKLEINSCSRPSILTSFRTTFTLELFKVLCCCCLKGFPFIAHSVMFGQLRKQQRRKGERPYFPAGQKDSEFKRPRFWATHINRKWAFFSVLPSALILIQTICPKNCSKSRLKSAKSQLPVDLRGSKTALLKLPNLNILSIIVSNLTHAYTFSYANMKATKNLQYYICLCSILCTSTISGLFS